MKKRDIRRGFKGGPTGRAKRRPRKAEVVSIVERYEKKGADLTDLQRRWLDLATNCRGCWVRREDWRVARALQAKGLVTLSEPCGGPGLNWIRMIPVDLPPVVEEAA